MRWFLLRSPGAASLPAAALLVLAVGCAAPRAGPGDRHVPPGAFALVGEQPVQVQVLLRSAAQGGVQAASQSLISDTLLALESGARNSDRAAVVERGILVRGLLDGLRQEALATSPPGEQETEEVASALWMQLDRPRCVRTVNIMAIVPSFGDGEREERVLRRIAEAVRGSGTPEEFGQRVGRVEAEGVDLQVIQVPPLTADGRVYLETAADGEKAAPPVEYARAAAALTHVGDTSDVVGTPVGFHVLMATDVLPPQVLAEDERQRRLRSAIADRRIGANLERLRQQLTSRASVWHSPHRSTLTSLVWRTQPGP